MLDVVAPKEDQLTLPVQFVDVHDPEAWLAPARRGLAREVGAASGEAPQHEEACRQNQEDDRKDDRELKGEGAIRAEER